MGFMRVDHSHRVGLRESRRQGIKEGEARYAALVDTLVKQKRYGDLERSAEDPAYRQELFEEFHIS